MIKRGIILAGGLGTRLYPATKTISKQILPIYDKPMIYYPLATLMLASIRDILIISTERDLPMLENILGDGSELGINITYKVQNKPAGIAESFIIGEDFINNENVCLILGDNILYGHELSAKLEEAAQLTEGACIFGYHVNDPERYGVVEFDSNSKAISIEEKPLKPKSSWAVTGLYFYDSNVVSIAKSLTPSKRGELEITDVNNVYLNQGNLKVELLGRGYAWLDTGTVDALMDAAKFVQILQERQGFKIACLEEVAMFKKFITIDQFAKLAHNYYNNEYGKYLKSLI